MGMRRCWLGWLATAVLSLVAWNVKTAWRLEQSLQKDWWWKNEWTFVQAPTGASSLSRPTTGAASATHHACDDSQGIYHIRMGDIGGAAGTIFYQFVIGQILWAERQQLTPWVHLDNTSYIVYDDGVHADGSKVQVTARVGRNATMIRREHGHWRDAVPGPLDGAPTHAATLEFTGNGVWQSYFEPVSDFVPGDRSCIDKLYVTLDLQAITPGIHGFADWAPKCWRYTYLPDYVTQPHVPLMEWLEPQRRIGHRVTTQYIRPLPYLVATANQVNPDCSLAQSCLGLHIRHSDKAAGRFQVPTSDFLPFAQAFVHSGGQFIYVATDSDKVLEEIASDWPVSVTSRLRSLGADVIRSKDDQPVFEIASHHRTNQEVLIEILALSRCQFLVGGLSAVSEASIWVNLGLHNRSVNLEDPDHLSAAQFGTLVQMALRGENADHWPRPPRTRDWWSPNATSTTVASVDPKKGTACEGFSGLLHIRMVGSQSSAPAAFFTDVLNQLLYAERYNLKPWVHLAATDIIHDPLVHGTFSVSLPVENRGIAIVDRDKGWWTNSFPGRPVASINEHDTEPLTLFGNGIWESYFEPVSDYIPGDSSCKSKMLVSLNETSVTPELDSYAPWAVRAWRYDRVRNHLWNTSLSLNSVFEPMRRRAHEIVKKYFRFQPYLQLRADEVNPGNEPCLAVHMRVGEKRGKYRTKVSVENYLPYMEAFESAGGRVIYVASDSHRALRFIEKTFPERIRNIMRTQGKHVVRTTKDWAPHMIDDHHRVNAEALVDILAMSKCEIMLHSYSTVSEAAIYLNFDLHKNSVNLEEPFAMPVSDFRALVTKVVGEQPAETASLSIGGQAVSQRRLDNATVLYNHGRRCKSNVVVYLAQKQHSSYGRDSYSILLHSLSLMQQNYLSRGNHTDNADVFIFHTGDFGEGDLGNIESILGARGRGSVYLVDLNNSPYWTRPKVNLGDEPTDWYAYPLFSEGYRRMMHWYAIDIWRFFRRWNQMTGCRYRYVFRLDEDSFIHSPIEYDIFDFFKEHNYVYGYRMCAYEMQVAQRMWNGWKRYNTAFIPKRELDLYMCGFYNNLFVADLQFFQRPDVSRFLAFIDSKGHIYRRRLGDLMIHTMTVIGFAEPQQIHRFLDFTYEHTTLNQTNGCPIWGGIQAGFQDPNAPSTLDRFYQTMLIDRGCPGNATFLTEPDLSPTYAHIPDALRGSVALQTIVAGRVELPAGKGILSG